MKTNINLLLAGVTAAFCCSTGNAQIVYSHDFTAGAAVNVDGTAPTAAYDYAGGSSSAIWNDALGVNNTHSMLANGVNSTTLGDSWLLPFTPQSGYLYTLTASLTFSGNPGNWVGLGFAQHDSHNVPSGYGRFSDSGNNGPTGYDWMILTESSGNVQYFGGAKAANTIFNANGAFTAGPQTLTAEVLLNTSGANWTVSAYVNGVQMGTNFTYSANPTISAVGFTQNALSTPANYQWNSLALTATVPEPSALALTGLGLAGLFATRRGRK
jgi:hypothetical protein